MKSDANKPERRPRFSLLNLIYLLTIGALGFGLYAANGRIADVMATNDRLAAENKDYRNQLGIFEIEDRTQVHVIRMPHESDEPHKFRVHLPPGRKYAVCYCANRIPPKDLPKHSTPHEVEPGGYVISVKISRRYGPGTWEPTRSVKVDLRVDPTDDQRNSSMQAGIGISEMKNDWIINKETGDMSYGMRLVGDELELHDPAEPLVLYRARAEKVIVNGRDDQGNVRSWSTEDYPGDCDGFMLWIEAVEGAEAGANPQ